MYAGGLGLELLLKMGWADECTVWADLDFQCLFALKKLTLKPLTLAVTCSITSER